MFQATSDMTKLDTLEIGGACSTKSVLADKRGLSTSIAESLGALALGIMVVAGLGVGIGAAYNYGQDSTAKSTLDSVKAAEVLYQAKSASFGDATDLTTGQDPALSSTADNLKITATATNYCAVVKSGSMFAPSYWITAQNGKILEAAPTPAEAGIACPTI